MTLVFSRSVVFAAMLVALASTAVAQATSPSPEKRTPTAEEVDRAMADVITDRFGGDRAKFLSSLREQGKTIREYRRELTARLEQTSGTSRQPAEAAEERVHLRLIQLNRRADETDEQLLVRGNEMIAKIKAGVAFADVAKAHSDDAKRAKGGDWGWLKRSDFKRDFGEVAFGLKKGEVSQPIVKPEGCFILFVEDRR